MLRQWTFKYSRVLNIKSDFFTEEARLPWQLGNVGHVDFAKMLISLYYYAECYIGVKILYLDYANNLHYYVINFQFSM